MKKPFEVDGVELEKAEAMRKYNHRRTYRILLRSVAVALLCYLWFPTVQIVGDWFYRTGSVLLTNRTFVFFLVNLLIVLTLVLSRNDEKSERTSSSETEPDRYTSTSSDVIVTGSFNSGEKVEEEVGEDDSKKQIVPAFSPEVVVVEEEVNRNREVVTVTAELKRDFRRTKSEKKKRELYRPVKEYRRTESAKMAIERMSSEEFRLKVETFIMEKKRSLVLENDVGSCRSPSLPGSGGYGSC